MSDVDTTAFAEEGPLVSYQPAFSTNRDPLYLILRSRTGESRRFPFYDRVEIGRYQKSRESEIGTLLLRDPVVSRHHCVVSQTTRGRCSLRDVSRNGTWLDGRRILPNLELELRVGQVIRLGGGHEFLLGGGSLDTLEASDEGQRTQSVIDYGMVSILVGDIGNYTSLVQRADALRLHRSVDRIFRRLEAALVERGASIKEYQGDAIFAYWSEKSCETHVVDACTSALHVERLVRRLADDPAVWDVPGFPLRMEWAIATGGVAIKTVGGDRPTGISMVGEPVILAFRLEKLANDETGCILVCPETRSMGTDRFEFRDLGKRHIDGFGEEVNVFSLLGDREAEGTVQ